MMHDGHGHEGGAPVSSTPTPGARNLCDQASHVQALEDTGNRGALPATDLQVDGLRQQKCSEVTVAEAMDRMFTTQNGLEEANIFFGGGIESAIASACNMQTPCTTAEQFFAFGWIGEESG